MRFLNVPCIFRPNICSIVLREPCTYIAVVVSCLKQYSCVTVMYCIVRYTRKRSNYSAAAAATYRFFPHTQPSTHAPSLRAIAAFCCCSSYGICLINSATRTLSMDRRTDGRSVERKLRYVVVVVVVGDRRLRRRFTIKITSK
jgi:hypothetical protein